MATAHYLCAYDHLGAQNLQSEGGELPQRIDRYRKLCMTILGKSDLAYVNIRLKQIENALETATHLTTKSRHALESEYQNLTERVMNSSASRKSILKLVWSAAR